MKSLSVERLCEEFPSEHLRELATFGALSDEVIMNLMTEGHLYELEKDEKLYSAGDKVQGFYIVLKGSMALYHHCQNIPTLTHHYGPGQQIGFVGMIALHERKGTAVAEQLSYVLSISINQFSVLHQTSPESFGLLMLNLAREMARTIGELGDLVAETELKGK